MVGRYIVKVLSNLQTVISPRVNQVIYVYKLKGSFDNRLVYLSDITLSTYEEFFALEFCSHYKSVQWYCVHKFWFIKLGICIQPSIIVTLYPAAM